MRPIDADALVDQLEREAADEWNRNTPTNWANAFCVFVDRLDEAPTIDAAPVRRGEWVAEGDDDQDEGMFFCSRCKDERWFGEEVHTSTEAARLCPYCPNCGADMRRVSE